MTFSNDDIKQITQHGLSPEEVSKQIQMIKKGPTYTSVLAPAKTGDGIIKLTEKEEKHFLDIFEQQKEQYQLQKFVPASGAATRMFKDWVYFYKHYRPGRDYYERFINKHQLTNFEPFLDDFLGNFPGFAFYQDLMDVIQKKLPGFFQLDENEQAWQLIHFTLSNEGLGYITHPKALIKFHRYHKDDIRTALDEQVQEALAYTSTPMQKAHVLFTINPAKQTDFDAHIQNLSQQLPVKIETTVQKPSTDAVMLDSENMLVRDEKGQIVFRPGGHGSLIYNLQDLDSDIVFIKNIDNVQKGEAQNISTRYKKILAGYLMDLMVQSKKYLTQLRDEKPIHEDLQAIEDFAKNRLNIHFIEGYDTLNNSGKRKYLAYKINRPLRVAGMVKNTGEPGGGPFWAKDKNGLKSLQIVEKAQIDTRQPGQAKALSESTHFNPVDLVLSLKDFEGNKFNLTEYINPEAAIISQKTYGDKPVKIYEHPGLWNGAMDGWNTVFIEVPLETFSPVKTVTDLLKPEHQ